MKTLNKNKLKIFSAFSLLVFWGWFLWIPSYYYRIPVDLESCLKSARIHMTVGSYTYLLDLDLGAKYCSLYPEHLHKIDKNFCKFVPGLDIHGNEYKDALYTVANVKVGDVCFSEICITEESPAFMSQGIIRPAKGKTVEEEIYACSGRAGRDVLGGMNFFLDFSRNQIILCKNFNDLTRDNYRLEKFVKVPVELNKMGICFRFETDLGPKILVLDSGSSHTFLRPSILEMEAAQGTFCGLPIWSSKKFVLNHHDFGNKDFYLYEISSKLEGMDGMLGLDFLKNYSLYVDVKKSVAYIGKSNEIIKP